MPDLEKEWGELSDDERFSQHHEWRNNTAILEDLEQTYRRAQMTPEQEERYFVLKAKAREYAPILERLGLDTIPESVLQDD